MWIQAYKPLYSCYKCRYYTNLFIPAISMNTMLTNLIITAISVECRYYTNLFIPAISKDTSIQISSYLL